MLYKNILFVYLNIGNIVLNFDDKLFVFEYKSVLIFKIVCL